MEQSNCGRTAAALALMLLGLPPAFAMDRIATDAGGSRGASGIAAALDSDADLAARRCPTRFDYLVLASFADAPSLLSFSTYHSRSEAAFSTIPLSGLLRVDYRMESGAGNCRARDFQMQTG
jgi:hypothetical protein